MAAAAALACVGGTGMAGAMVSALGCWWPTWVVEGCRRRGRVRTGAPLCRDGGGGMNGVARRLVACGGSMRGALEELAFLGHGGLEVVSADIYVWAVGMEVRWWSSPSLFLDSWCGFSVAAVVGPDGLRCMFLRCRGGIAGGYRVISLTVAEQRWWAFVCCCWAEIVRKARC
jgi:hypothetical protein